MRYAIVTDTYPPDVNGVALTLHGLARGLLGLGHVVEVVRPSRPGESADSDALTVAALPVPGYPGLRFGVPAGRSLLRRWGANRPDAIYVATEGALGWSALRCARRLGIPVATGFHTRFDAYMRDFGAPWLEPVAMRWMRGFHNRGDATIVATRDLAEQLAVAGFCRVAIVPRAVDVRRFSPAHRDPALREAWGVGEHGLAVVLVGRLSVEKNLGLAVRAVRALQRVRPDARFVLVGDGPCREALQREHPDFIFSGMQHGEALARHFASADLFAFPSTSETFGNVTLEALASGVPTVAFDYGAAREHLRHGRHGYRVRLGDEAGFVRAVVHLGTDADTRRRFASAAPAAVADLRPEWVATGYDRLLRSLAAERRGCHARAA